MPVYIVTGKLGGGKTLLSVSKIQEALWQGRKVATNLDLNLAYMLNKKNRTARVMRVPDKPSAQDLYDIGKGNKGYDESKNGLLVLDECGTWFNSRNWNDKTRGPVNDWFLHARKLGWDVFIIVQNIDLLDSQARKAIAEHTVFCLRTDRLPIPFVGWIIGQFTSLMKLPKIHMGRVVYGTSPTDMCVDRWIAQGKDLYLAYDTKQAFLDSYDKGIYSILPPGYHAARKLTEWNRRNIMRLTKILWRKFASPVALGAGMLIGTSLAVAFKDEPVQENIQAVVQEIKKPEEVPPTELERRVQGYHIVGYVGGARGSIYYFRGPESQEYSSYELEELGYHVEPRTQCEVEIQHEGQSAEVYCL